ncbi:N-acetyltransferase [Bacillus salacetis]|uniref:N-acetyltransferase n=1 Tax=Bacillus salacetis TaxID=2315464 RepID=A0A3A1R6Y8_9BACI|nr:GNAT family protein [Bacillus salacetis]RIW37281.1 N-acetyltransferase [Bacillus salacetis]
MSDGNSHFPSLQTERLFLRNVTPEDASFIFKLYSNPEVCRYLYDEEIYTSLDDAREFIEWNQHPEETGNNRWLILRKDDGEPIGTCGYDSWDSENRIAEIGYDLWQDEWGKGYMKETLAAAIKSGFDNMGLNRINAYTAIKNEKSSKLLESLGFIKEGIYRDKHLFRGSFYDHFSYSLLKRDWMRRLSEEK